MKTAPSAAWIGEPCPPCSEMPPTRTAAMTSIVKPENRFATARPNWAAAEMPAMPQQTPNKVIATMDACPTRRPDALAASSVGADQQQLPSEPSSLQDEPRHQGQNDEGPALRRNAERTPGSEPFGRLGAEQDVLVVADQRGETAKQRAKCQRRDDRVPAQRDDAALNGAAPRGENEGDDQADGQSVVVSHQEREDARRKDREFFGGQREEIAGDRDVGHPDRDDAGDRRSADHHQQVLKRQKARRGEAADHQQRDNPNTHEQEREAAARGRLRLCRRSAGRRKAPKQTGDHAASLPAARVSG